MSPESKLPLWLALPYAAWAVTSFLVLGLLTLLAILLLPGLVLRRRVARRAARLALAVAGMRVIVLQGDNLPEGPCVVVANHASYLDGVLLFAALPTSFGFVIKREMNDVPLAGLLLRRLGSHFVDRGGAAQGKRDARALLRQARAGGAMAFFPEGTFRPEPGLGRFRPGAFVMAANGGMPVVPVAIRGTRRALPSDGSPPRPTRLEVEIMPPLPAPVAGEVDSINATLRAARAAILGRIPEPDLAPDG